MGKIIVSVTALLSLLALGACSSDDPAAPGGGSPGDGVAYTIPPFEVVRHGIALYDVWTDGETTITVGSNSRAFVQTAAGRFILPVSEQHRVRLTGVSSTGAGQVYITGARMADFNPDSPPIVRFEDGLRYTESVDVVADGTSIWCGSRTTTYLTVGRELWRRANGAWELDHDFVTPCYGFYHGGGANLYVATAEGLFAFESLIWEKAYDATSLDGCWAVGGLDEDQVLTVDGEDVIVRDGGIAFELAYHAGAVLHDVAWAAEGWAVAVGEDGTVAMHDGVNWSRIQVDFAGPLMAVAAWKDGGQSRALAVGLDGAEYRYADGDWTGSYLPDGHWQDIAGDGQGNLYGIFTHELEGGAEETILYTYDGSDWDRVAAPEGLVLGHMHCRDAESIWGIGRANNENWAARFNGATWQTYWVSSVDTVNDIWVADDGQAHVACDHGTVYVNLVPEIAASPERNLYGIWGVGATDVFAVGESGTIARKQGAVWAAMASGTDEHLRAVHGAGADHVVAVGDNGTVLRLAAGAWTALDPGLDEDLDEVWTDGAQNIWVGASRDDLVAHFDGSGWETYRMRLLDPGPRAVWSDGQEVWVSAGSALLRYAEPPSFAAILGTR
ncbi:MAG: hypothetical protein IH621_00175 [Krumholzibacteria bacterium]|nr:hypothetical protein [Candidatus Krumholzibacteria bacterium]